MLKDLKFTEIIRYYSEIRLFSLISKLALIRWYCGILVVWLASNYRFSHSCLQCWSAVTAVAVLCLRWHSPRDRKASPTPSCNTGHVLMLQMPPEPPYCTGLSLEVGACPFSIWSPTYKLVYERILFLVQVRLVFLTSNKIDILFFVYSNFSKKKNVYHKNTFKEGWIQRYIWH